MVIYNVEAGPVEDAGKMLLRDRHPDGHRESLAEWTVVTSTPGVRPDSG